MTKERDLYETVGEAICEALRQPVDPFDDMTVAAVLGRAAVGALRHIGAMPPSPAQEGER